MYPFKTNLKKLLITPSGCPDSSIKDIIFLQPMINYQVLHTSSIHPSHIMINLLITTKMKTIETLLIKLIIPLNSKTLLFLVVATKHIPLTSRKLNNKIEYTYAKGNESTIHFPLLTRASLSKGFVLLSIIGCTPRSWITDTSAKFLLPLTSVFIFLVLTIYKLVFI